MDSVTVQSGPKLLVLFIQKKKLYKTQILDNWVGDMLSLLYTYYDVSIIVNNYSKEAHCNFGKLMFEKKIKTLCLKVFPSF